MELLYILYKPLYKQSRYLLVLPLGNRGGKLCVLSTQEVVKGDINQIISNKKRLASLSLERKIMWLRNNCPDAYKNGYREIYTNNFSVVSKHPLVRD